MAAFNDIIKSEQPVLVDFYATWCQPCKVMAPILNQVADQVKGKARVLKVDVDKSPKVMAAYGIRGVPTLILFQNGEIKWRQSGVVPADELLRQINTYAA